MAYSFMALRQRYRSRSAAWLVALVALAWSACDPPDAQPSSAAPEVSHGDPGHPATQPAAFASTDTRADEPADAIAAGPAGGIDGHRAAGAGADGKAMGVTPDERPRVAALADEFHVDQREPRTRRPTARSRPADIEVERRPLHIKLLSTPSGALAAVDGTPIGRTPAFWQGEFTGKPREFTFVLPGHAMARYRFVPTTNGVVHGTLVKLAAEPDDAHEARRDHLDSPDAGPGTQPGAAP